MTRCPPLPENLALPTAALDSVVRRKKKRPGTRGLRARPMIRADLYHAFYTLRGLK
jgi:prenyltransferase beta subunit